MRIIFEMNEADAQSMKVERETVTGKPAAEATGAPIDGGSPPETLLAALGARTAGAAEPGADSARAVDAGQPPAWMLNMPAGPQRPM